MMPIVYVLIDAAILYSAALLTILVCFICANNAQYIMLDMVIITVSARCKVLLNLDQDHANHLDFFLYGVASPYTQGNYSTSHPGDL
jgi:hypothetical protein